MLWNHYIFRRGDGVHDLWDNLFDRKSVRLLYIAGHGFDVRAPKVMDAFVQNLKSIGRSIDKAELLLVNFTGYQLSEELTRQTEENETALRDMFGEIGTVVSVSMGASSDGDDEVSASSALKQGLMSILDHLDDQTDIVLDVSSLPRVVYLALMIGILHKLIPDKKIPNALSANNVNFQVLVAEDVNLDSNIRSEEPSNELILVPGFSSALHAESVREWPSVWFPILGENRLSQLEKIIELAPIPANTEICPVLPHPSKNPRRADQLLKEYGKPLFESHQIPTTSILYAHESHPFEAYRQLLLSMKRYLESMSIIGGCRLVMTPLASKLITLGAGLACFEMRTDTMEDEYLVAIPYAEPTRYSVSIDALSDSTPEISSLLLTGIAYNQTATEKDEVM